MMVLRAKVRISNRPIKPEAVLDDVRTPHAGGIVTFVGTVRSSSQGLRVSGMELEAAIDLAEKDLRRITIVAGKRHSLSKVSIVHRIGKLKIGDVIVVIAVSSPHRADAFAACKFMIDELKKTTPIWKKEFIGKKGTWVEGA